MKGTDVWVVLVGPARSGKTKLARATQSLVSDFLEIAKKRPPMHDPYYVYANLFLKASQRGLRELVEELNRLPSTYRAYRDTKLLREISKTSENPPILLGSVLPQDMVTGLELKTFAIPEITPGYNLFVFDMYGKDFEMFFMHFIQRYRGALLGDDKDELVSILVSGFLEFLEKYGIQETELINTLSRIRKASDLRSFFKRARKAVRETYMGATPYTPDEITLIVLFAAMTGLYSEQVRTTLLLVYGPESLDDRETLDALKTFRDIAMNTRKRISNAPQLLGITHAKIDIMYKEFIDRSSSDPLSFETRDEFVKRYVSQRLRGPYVVKSVHASLHDDELSQRLQENIGEYIPVMVPYNVLAPIYALFELSTKGRTSVPTDLYRRTLPYPYAHIYFALEGGI